MHKIGNTKEGFIVEISKLELSQLGGFTSIHDEKFENFIKKDGPFLSIGDVYKDAVEAVTLFELLKSSISTLKGASTKMIKLLEGTE